MGWTENEHRGEWKAHDRRPEPGQFAKLERTWMNGDRIEIEFDMPTVLEPVDPQHPNLMATVHGPLTLFAVGDIPRKM